MRCREAESFHRAYLELRDVVRAFPDYRVKDGKVAEVWVTADNYSLVT